MTDRRDLSKAVAHALRHDPGSYQLELDEQGWASLDMLVAALRRRSPSWRDLTTRGMVDMVERSGKRRYELRGSRIRALYGHSVSSLVLNVRAEAPPAVLYHGTAPESIPPIMSDGLKPMRRKYVHLSSDAATAVEVGRRKSRSPVVLRVAAASAACNGVEFYRGSDRVWLAESVAATYLSIAKRRKTSDPGA